MSGLVAEKIMILGRAEQMITERSVGEEFLHILLARHRENPARLCPELPERRVIHEASARARRGVLLQLEFALIRDDIDHALGVERKVVKKLVVVQHAVARPRLRLHEEREILRAGL